MQELNLVTEPDGCEATNGSSAACTDTSNAAHLVRAMGRGGLISVAAAAIRLTLHERRYDDLLAARSARKFSNEDVPAINDHWWKIVRARRELKAIVEQLAASQPHPRPKGEA